MTGSIFHFLVSGAFLKILPDRIFVHIVSDKHSLAGVFLFCAGDAVAVIGDIKLEKLVSGCELAFCTDDISKRSANGGKKHWKKEQLQHRRWYGLKQNDLEFPKFRCM